MPIEHYAKLMAIYLTMWRSSIKSNPDNVVTELFLSVLWVLFSKTFQIHYFIIKTSRREMLVA